MRKQLRAYLTNKAQDLMASLLNPTEELMPILLTFFKKIGTFYKASITVMPKPDKDTTENENYEPVSLMSRGKNPQQNTSKPNLARC